MPYKTPIHLRKSAFNAQAGLCCYCGKPMWLDDPEAFAKANDLSLAQVRWLKCTAEHLQARSEGGEDAKGNIAAACLFCNRKRHQRKCPLPPDKYRHYVRNRVSKGRWNEFH